MKYFNLLAAFLLVLLAVQPIKAQDMNSKITTFLMFEGDAEEAINFYMSLFDDSEIVSMTKYGPDGPGAKAPCSTPYLPSRDSNIGHLTVTLITNLRSPPLYRCLYNAIRKKSLKRCLKS